MANKKTNTAYPSAKPPSGSSYAVMSTGGFVLASLLMCIPFIGLLICIIWAFVSCSNENRRNFARACLILMIIGIVLSLAAYLATAFLVSKLAIFGDFGGLKGIIEMWKGLKDL